MSDNQGKMMYKHNVGVVIPFFQREKGILSKSLTSIFNQSVDDILFTIVIVDDESPVSADQELLNLTIPNNCIVKLIKQKNGGPANARNTGLNFLQQNPISTVAFLDSDDVWEKSHIHSAITALEDGADFYFCDHNRFDSKGTWFSTLNFVKDWEKTLSDFNISDNKINSLLSLSGEDCFRLFLTDYLSQTSSVVYNFNEFSAFRFDPSLVGAGEDFLLWLQLVSQCKKVSFSLDANLYCGEGVNVYFDSFDWNKLASSSQQGYRYLLYFKIFQHFQLSDEQSEYILRQKSLFVWRYSYLMSKHLILGKGLNANLLKSIFRLSPITTLIIPFRFLIAILIKSKLQVDKDA